MKSKREIAQEISDELGLHMSVSITLNTDEVLQSCKDQLRIHIEMLLENNVPARVVEIELLHYMKNLLYPK